MGYMVSRDDGWRMPDWLWERMAPLLPDPPFHPLGCHAPRVPDRDAMDAILMVLRTGMQWNALNATGVCSSSRRTGVFRSGSRPVCFTRSGARGCWSTTRWWDRLVVSVGRRAMTKARWVARRRARTLLIGPRGGEALGPHGGAASRSGRSRRREPQRPQAAEGHARLDPDRAPAADLRAATGHLPGQGI